MPHTAPHGAPPQHLVGGRYTDLQEIGRGASSVVYRGTSPDFGRNVAIKLFHGSIDDPELRQRFLRECHTVGRLGDHPHIVSVFDNGFTPDRRPFLVMPYCSGGSFGQRLRGQGPRPVDEILTVGVAVADALHEAHTHGVVHRDVKPHNVLLTGYGVVTLADFGVAVEGAPDSASLAATPGYAAPEVVVDARAAAPASDVYSLGATLFALVTGGPPFRPGPEESDLVFLLRTVEQPSPRVPEWVPLPLAELIGICLAKDAADRPASALAVRDELRAIAARLGADPGQRLPLLPLPAPAGGERIADLHVLPGTDPPAAPADPAGPERHRRRAGLAAVLTGLAAGVTALVLAVIAPSAPNVIRLPAPADAATVPAPAATSPAPATGGAVAPPTGSPDSAPVDVREVVVTTQAAGSGPAPVASRTGTPAPVRTVVVTAPPATGGTAEPDPTEAPATEAPATGRPGGKGNGKKPTAIPSATGKPPKDG